MNKLLSGFVKITGWFPFALVHRTKYYYEDKKVQGRHIKGKAIIISNHHSILDFSTFMFAFPFRDIRCVTAEVLYQKNFLFSWFLKSLGCLKVDRQASDVHFVNSVIQKLDKGKVIEIYPESRLPLPGECSPLPFYETFVYIALQSGSKIIPCATNGEYFSKKRLKVYIGKPIDPTDLFDDTLSEKENIKRISLQFRDKIIGFTNEFKK